MAFLTKKRDLRGQFERYSADGSEHVDPNNPNRNNIGGADRSPLVTKPFEFKYNQVNSRATDLERFVKFLGTPSGLKMQANIAILQQSGRDLRATFNKNKKAGGSKVGNILRAAKAIALDTIKGNLGFTANIAKQIPLNGTGTHFVNNLNGPTYLKQGGDPKSALGNFLKDTIALPETAFGMRIGGSAPLGPDPEGAGAVKSNFVDGTDRLMDSSYDTEPNLSDDLLQDPIRSAKKTLDAFAKKANKSLENSKRQALGEKSLSGEPLLDNSAPLSQAFAASRYTRVNKQKGEEFKGTSETEFNTPVYKPSQDEDVYTVSKYTIDYKLNDQGKELGTFDIHEDSTVNVELDDNLPDTFKKDIIPFRFSSITPESSKTFLFQALLDSYDDNYTANWNSTQYVGRGEEFFTFNNSTRNITFSFKAASFNKDSLDILYKKLNLLAGTTAANYSEGGNFMRGTLTRITIGDLLYRQNGFITSIGLSWNNSYQWEIDAYEEGLEKLPHVLNVSVSFTPLHSFNVKSDVNLDDEKYFGKRTINPPQPRPKVRKKKITPEIPKEIPKDPLALTPTMTPTIPVSLDFTVPNAVSDTVQFTTTGQGLDTIGTGDERKRGQKGGYIVD